MCFSRESLFESNTQALAVVSVTVLFPEPLQGNSGRLHSSGSTRLSLDPHGHRCKGRKCHLGQVVSLGGAETHGAHRASPALFSGCLPGHVCWHCQEQEGPTWLASCCYGQGHERKRNEVPPTAWQKATAHWAGASPGWVGGGLLRQCSAAGSWLQRGPQVGPCELC